jgi:putative two-component system response regulator
LQDSLSYDPSPYDADPPEAELSGPGQGSVLVVDDTVGNLHILARELSARGYRVRAALNGQTALYMMASEVPDLVLLDTHMPGLDGPAVTARMQALRELRDIPVLLMHAADDPDLLGRSFRDGARDYVTKPFVIPEVLGRVATQMELIRLRHRLQDQHKRLSGMLVDQVRELTESQVATIIALSKLSESRERGSAQHIDRVRALSELLAWKVATQAVVRESPAEFAELIRMASALHDIGKVSIPDAILAKPGPLEPDELEIARAHTTFGYDTLQAVQRSYPNNAMLKVGAQIARSHHEHWDGSGYPDGLLGALTPLPARIVALVHAYDVARSERPYKRPLPHEAAAATIHEGRGTLFDPVLVDAFAGLEGEFERAWTVAGAGE